MCNNVHMDSTIHLSQLFKALGDPTRLRIVECLACCSLDAPIGSDGEIRPTAGQICCMLTGDGAVTSTLSHHLKELRNAGIIRMERQGRRMLCSLDPQATGAIQAFLQRISIESSQGESK
jgi:ArsR family transcriptional regulator